MGVRRGFVSERSGSWFFIWVEEGRDKSCLHVQRILMSIATHTRSISSKVGSYANIVSQRISSWSKGNSLPNKRRIHRLRITTVS